MAKSGWIKIHRSLLDWEWYKDTNTKVLFIHILLSATTKTKKLYNQTIKRGQYITTITDLSNTLRLTQRQVRTALSHLQQSGNITVFSCNKYSLITVINFDLWQERHTTVCINDTQNDTQTTNKKEPKNQVNKPIKDYQAEAERQTNDTLSDTQTTRGATRLKQEERRKNNNNICCCSCIDNIYIPSLLDIQEYINNNNYTFKAEYFYNYYKSRNWQVGKSKINSQEQLYALLDNWQIKEKDPAEGKPSAENKNTFTNYDQKIYTDEQIEEILRRKKEGS